MLMTPVPAVTVSPENPAPSSTTANRSAPSSTREIQIELAPFACLATF
jgi:hypothetical protein